MWLKKAFPWLGIILYLFDVLSDIVVGADFIERCHYNYAVSVFAFVWLPGLLIGGFFSGYFQHPHDEYVMNPLPYHFFSPIKSSPHLCTCCFGGTWDFNQGLPTPLVFLVASSLLPCDNGVSEKFRS